MRTVTWLLALSALASTALAGTRPWTLDDILGTRTVSDPETSPDGEWIAFVVTELNDDKSDYQSDVWLVSKSGADAHRLAASLHNDDAPRWSPDGTTIAFLSERPRTAAREKAESAAADDDGKRQLWLIRPFGGEAWRLSDAKGGVSSFEWSADGRKIAYLSREPKSEERRKKEKEKDDAWTPKDRYAWNRLWVIDVETRKASQLTSGAFHVTGFSFSPDGRQLAIAGQPSPLIPDNFHSDLYLVPTAGGRPSALVQRKGLDNRPAWSPDGKWIAFSSQSGNTPWFSNLEVCVVAATGGAPRSLTTGFDERANDFVWAGDSRSVLFQAIERTAAHVYRASLEGTVEPLTRGPHVDGAFSVDPRGRALVFLRQSAERPPDVHLVELPDGEARALTRANPQVDGLLAFRKEPLRWKGPDGLDIDGLVVYPPGYRKGQKVPLLLNVHGGPAGTHTNSWVAASRTYAFPLFAQKGYAILFPNPRGSGGYGAAFRAANVRDWGGKDYQDIMAGVDHLVAAGVVDPGRMAVCGWSYGGFMTSTIVTKTDRFRAASVGAGVTDLFSMAMTCDIPEFNRDYFGSWPWEDPAFYVEHSAMMHVNRVRTPTLVVHGEKDERVPPTQGWEFYGALRKVGVPTDLLLIPRAPHGPREPKLLRSIVEWQRDWIDRYTLGTAPAAKVVPRNAENVTGTPSN